PESSDHYRLDEERNPSTIAGRARSCTRFPVQLQLATAARFGETPNELQPSSRHSCHRDLPLLRLWPLLFLLCPFWPTPLSTLRRPGERNRCPNRISDSCRLRDLLPSRLLPRRRLARGWSQAWIA